MESTVLRMVYGTVATATRHQLFLLTQRRRDEKKSENDERSGNGSNGPREHDAQKTISRIWQQKHPKMTRLIQKIKNRQRTGITEIKPPPKINQ